MTATLVSPATQHRHHPGAMQHPSVTTGAARLSFSKKVPSRSGFCWMPRPEEGEDSSTACRRWGIKKFGEVSFCLAIFLHSLFKVWK